MTTIETARTLLAKESPELRRAVGELVRKAIEWGEYAGETQIKSGGFPMGQHVPDRLVYWEEVNDFSRELIEDKGGKQ